MSELTDRLREMATHRPPREITDQDRNDILALCDEAEQAEMNCAAFAVQAQRVLPLVVAKTREDAQNVILLKNMVRWSERDEQS